MAAEKKKTSDIVYICAISDHIISYHIVSYHIISYPPTPLWGHQAWEIVPPPNPLRCGPTPTDLQGEGGLNWDRDAFKSHLIVRRDGFRSSCGLQTLANSVCKRHRALQTLANSVWKRHRPTEIVIRASSTEFTQASAAKMGCARDPS